MLDRKEIEIAKKKYGNVTTNPLTPLNFLKRSELVSPTRKRSYIRTNPTRTVSLQSVFTVRQTV
jgi:hypothetical protein